jgi:hypothetical protein
MVNVCGEESEDQLPSHGPQGWYLVRHTFCTERMHSQHIQFESIGSLSLRLCFVWRQSWSYAVQPTDAPLNDALRELTVELPLHVPE